MSSDNSEDEVTPPSPLHLPAYLEGNTDYQTLHEKELKLVEEETQRRIKCLLEGTGELSKLDPQTFSDPEILRRLTSSVSSALDEAASALNKIRSEAVTKGDLSSETNINSGSVQIEDSSRLLAEACSQGDWLAVQQLLSQGRNIHQPGEDGESLLSLACSAGSYELVEVLLKMRSGMDDKGMKDCTPLMESSSGGYSDIVKLLLDHGVEVNAKSAAGNTALTYACCGGHEEVVKILLERGASIEEPNENGHTPLMEAASGGHIGVAKLLLRFGANINTHSVEFKESALTLSCYKGHLGMVRFLLGAGADQEHKTDEMHTALMEASMDGHVDVARLLLDHGAQVNMPADSFESPLTLSACGGHHELAALLISRGADLEEVNDEGYTPLMEAAREGHDDVITLLVENGANVNAQTEETQETALTLACCGGFLQPVKYLISKGADIELGASTPLMEASQEGHYFVVSYLIEQGANIHAMSAALETALTCAAGNGHRKVCELLLSRGANLEHKSEGGRTPLMKAARSGHLETVKFLVERGADVNRATTSRDHTVLSLACAGGHIGVVQYLLMKGADPSCLLKDNSTILIEAAKGGHTHIACFLLTEDIRLQSTMMANASSINSTPVPSNLLMNPSSINSSIIPSNALVTPSATSAVVPSLQQQALLRASQAGLLEGVLQQMTTPTLDQEGVLQQMTTPADQDLLPHQLTTPTSNQENVSHQKTTPTTDQSRDPTKTTFNFGKQHPSVAMAMPMSQHHHLSRPPPSIPGQIQKGSRKRAAPPEDLSSDESSNDDIPYPCQQPRQDPIGQSSPQVYEQKPSVSTLRLPSNSYLGDFDNPRLPDFLPPRNRGLLKSLNGTGLRRAFSMEAIPSELMYGSEGRGSHTYQSTATQIVNQIVPMEGPLGSVAMPTKQEILQFQEMLFQRVQQAHGQAVVGQDYRYYGYHTEDDFDDGGEGDDEDDGDDEVDQRDPCFRGREMLYPPPRSGSIGTSIPVDAQTDSNHDTALTLAAQGGYDKLVQLLLSHSADIEHKDKKGCTPLILAASAGHVVTVTVLLDHGANIEAVSDRTKDTALSLACSGGRQEVVDVLLQKKANFEHRNVSDYTPLSLAASGGYVSIMKALLRVGADVNSRTGSKLGITPLMLASMNGHTQAVRLLLDHGADINAQIETNKNTALTLACFQGRQEVVSLLCTRGGNVEHRAKTGLTPLMEAASGGYHEVGKVLVEHGADLNAPPVPSSKDTPLTIAADKGHVRFVDMVLKYGASVEVKNKKGNSPLWLACNGGHYEVVRCLLKARADPDSQDNRKVSCLITAFKKGHVKVVKCLVEYVTQFPSDGDCRRFVSTIADKDHLKRSVQCLELISRAKERQEAEANKNANILLQELDMEKQNEEQKKLAAAKKRERKKRQKEKKKAKASEDVIKQEDLQDEDSVSEPQPCSDLVAVMTTRDMTSSVVATITTTITTVTTTTLTARAVSAVEKTNSTTPTTTPTTTDAVKATKHVTTPKRVALETTPMVSVAMTTAKLKSPLKTSVVSTAAVAMTTIIMSNSVTLTTSPRKGRKEDGSTVTSGWREVHKKAKTTSRRSRSSLKESVQRDSPSKDIFQFEPLTKDAGHHPGDSYKDGLRDKMASRVPITPNISTNSSKVKSQPSYQVKTSSSTVNNKVDRFTKGKTPTTLTTSTAMQVTKATNIGSHDSTYVPASKDHTPQSPHPPPPKAPKSTTIEKVVTMTTATRPISTAPGTSTIPSASNKGEIPLKTIPIATSSAVTSVTMTTKHPIASVGKQPSGSTPQKKGLVTPVKKPAPPSNRSSQSLANKGISYSAIVGGAKVKEENLSSPLNILSIATSNSDGTYQPFGPVVEASSEHKTTPTTTGSGSPWMAPTTVKTSPSCKSSTLSTEDSNSTPSKSSPSNTTGSELSIAIDTETSGKHLGPIGPPSHNERSPQTSLNDKSPLAHSPLTADEAHSPITSSDCVVKETTSAPSHPLLPTPIGPPTALRPSDYPIKSTMVAGMPVGGTHPGYQPTRGPRPPLLPHPMFSQNQQPMAYYPIVEPQGHIMYSAEMTSPFGSGGEPPKGGVQEGVGLMRNIGSGFNPNATPFIPSYLHGMSQNPPANIIGVSPEVLQPQRGYPVQMVYQHQYNVPQEGVVKVPGPPGQGVEAEWGKVQHQRVIPVHQPIMQNAQIPAPHLHTVAVTMVPPQPVPSPGYPIMLSGQQMSSEGPIAMANTSATSIKILENLPPIGTERAHKRSSSYGNSIQFSSTLYGTEDVWGFSEASPTPFVWGTTSTNVTMATTTDSTVVTKVEEQVAGFHDDDKQSKFVIASSDTIDSVLNRLSLSDHLPLFKSNEIDLNALLLMTDKDYSELGIKEGPRLKLLTAIGNQNQDQSEEHPAHNEEVWLEETQHSVSASNSQ